MAIALVAIVFLGFAPSFYLRDIVPAYPRPNPSLTPFVVLHGSLFTLWMLILIAQTQLISAGRRDTHMKLGVLGMALALAILPVMYLAAVWQVARANQPPFTDPLNWTAVPLATIPAFAILVWQGWTDRREAQWHKRLMLSAAILVVLGPAIGRMPIAPPSLLGHTVQVTIGLALFVPLMLWDRRSQSKVHPATWLGFTVAAAAYFVPIVLMATESWGPIARHLPGVGA
jgi:cytochrome bd-type quinol oxidase subunit 2